MKKMIISFAVFFAVASCFAQDKSIAHSINKAAWEEEISPEVMAEMGIEYPIFKVFQYEDLKGEAMIVLTENNVSKNSKGEPVNTAISAFLLRGSNGNFTKEWENSHDISKDAQSESSIWYWSKYFDCMDVDNDTESETFLVFGTAGDNGFDDGRVFIEIYYEGKLISIEHQNAVKDMDRILLISPDFYKLPGVVQEKAKYKMKQMVTAKQAIFPNNWEQKMAAKKTEIRER
ncbi:M949_RS01915 family surface polysaccharide biosynthesis protein [Frigoriflavimonas asaccharolytica]|uniref:Uncharacterized protein n=1 Tax=Frigoriflavimonas asaccharolytica TaxID=2735899 RepID=A0A8J8G526_9FLAO|nr:hypothetical protein [Frigoriflavimonas asaccharolytica]NRS91283.1 hypothetical protein [Frigoriflavimonas asaccharolytica]